MKSDSKILFVTHYCDLYGANRSLLNLIDGLKKLTDSDITVLFPGSDPLKNELEQRNIATIESMFYSSCYDSNARFATLKAISKFLLNRIYFLQIKNKIRGLSFDYVHSNSSVTDIGFKISKFLSTKHIWHIREFVDLDYGLSYFPSKSSFEKKLNKTSAIISISKSISEHRSRHIKIPSERKVQIYNGIYFENEIPKAPTLVKDKTEVTFGMIGVLHPAKGHLEAINGLKSFQDSSKGQIKFKFLIAGDGDLDYVKKLQDQIKENNLSQIISFLGLVDNPVHFYNKIDILLMPSRNEGMGRVTVEAMFNKKVVIGYDSAGNSELIKHKKTGFLYSSQTELLECLNYVCNPKNEITSITEAAYNEALSKYTIEAYTRNYLNLLQTIN